MLHDPRLQAAEDGEAENTHPDGDQGRDQQAASARPPAVNQGASAVADDPSHRIHPDQPAPFRRHHQVEVDDRRQPEADLQDDPPQVTDVAEAHVERRQEQRGAECEQDEVDQQQGKADGGEMQLGAGEAQDDHEDEEIDHEGQTGAQQGRVDDDFARQDRLGEQLGARQQRAGAVRRPLGEEVPQHDAEQQEAGVVGDVEAHEEGEDDVVDAEEHQGIEHRPRVAQYRVGVADLEVLEGELQDQRSVRAPAAPPTGGCAAFGDPGRATTVARARLLSDLSGRLGHVEVSVAAHEHHPLEGGSREPGVLPPRSRRSRCLSDPPIPNRQRES